MLKKILCLLLIALLLTGCTPAPTPTDDAPTFESNASETTVLEETVDENAPVDVVLPTAFFAGTDMSEFDPEEYAEAQGYEAAVVNEDGSVTVTMSAEKYDSMLKKLERNILDLIDDYLRSADTDYIQSITYNEDYSLFTMTVDRAAYQAAFDTTPVSLLLNAALYHMLIPGDAALSVEIIDAETQALLDTVTY